MKNLTQKIILAISLLGFVILTACGQTENTQNEEQTTKIENEAKKDSGKIKFKEENTDNPFEGFNLADHPEMSVQKWNTLSTEAKANFAREKKVAVDPLANFDYASQGLDKKTWESLTLEEKNAVASSAGYTSVSVANALKEEKKIDKENNDKRKTNEAKRIGNAELKAKLAATKKQKGDN